MAPRDDHAGHDHAGHDHDDHAGHDHAAHEADAGAAQGDEHEGHHHPETLADLVAELGALAEKVRGAIESGDKDAGDAAVHDFGHLVEDVEPLAKEAKLPEAVEAAERIFSDGPFAWSILGHVADGNFHALLLVDPEDSDMVDSARRAAKQLTAEVIALGGTCTGEHGIGLGKREALVEQVGAGTIEVMRAVKEALDPRGILNPGKVLLT